MVLIIVMLDILNCLNGHNWGRSLIVRIILISVGSGKRLWPISNYFRAKQFLKVLDNGNNGLESMIQRVWGQLKTAGLDDSALIAAGKSHADIIQSQLGESVKLVIEPECRDTYPAIALAAAYLFSVEKLERDEIVAVLPVDLFVEAPFFQRVAELENVLGETGADLALVGVTPASPSEKYGYIVPVPCQEVYSVVKVSHFKEKPSKDTARDLIVRSALWNCGVFAFRLGYIISKLEEDGLPTSYLQLENAYDKMPRNSFDYEVVEKAKSVVAISYQGKWKDLGTWNDLTEEMAAPVIGNGFISKDSLQVHIINELDIPLVVLGLSNVVAAASPDGILVADKNESHKVKELVDLFRQRPMYEERRWGCYRVLDHAKYENGQEVLTKRVSILAGKNLSYQMHAQRDEVWSIVKGEGELALCDVLYKIKQGDVLHIPAGVKHGIKADTELEFIEIQTGADLVEGDITRIYTTWQEVVNHCHKSREHIFWN
jgi:mannose-1-phosphate guanylyltransferase